MAGLRSWPQKAAGPSESCLTALSSRRIVSASDRAAMLADLRRVLRLEPRGAERASGIVSEIHRCLEPRSETGDEPTAALKASAAFKSTAASVTNGPIKRRPQWTFGHRPSDGSLCRTDAHLEQFQARILPVMRLLGKLLELAHPEAHTVMMAERAKLEAPCFPGTPFLTAALNLSHPSSAHRDVNDLRAGMSAMVVFHPRMSCDDWRGAPGGGLPAVRCDDWARDDEVSGGELALPEHGLAIRFGTSACSLVFFKAHELLHGNLPIQLADQPGGSSAGQHYPQRISLVCFCPRVSAETEWAPERLRPEIVSGSPPDGTVRR